VLGGEREPWLTVDPCLLRGDIGFDLARCLWDRLHEMPDAATINEQLDIIADAAGSTGNTLAAQRSSAPSTTGCGVSSMDSPRILSAAGVSSPRCFSDPPFTPTGDHA